jgi:hypothetical protein
MNATLSTRQLRLVLVLGLVVVAAAGYVVTQHKSASPTTAGSKPAVTTPALTTPAPSKAHVHAVAPQVKLDTHGLPVKVALALQKHSVVVVSLSQPGADVDQLAAAEAKVGAAAGHAGYVNLNVDHQRPGTAVLRKFGVLTTPDVLVVKRVGVYSVFPGFVDHSVVEQAVADAR